MSSGKIAWADLTVPDAEEICEFYRHVAGWDAVPQSMGAYNDYSMVRKGEPEKPIAGICHAQGANRKIPPVWLVYLPVEDLDVSLRECTERGGRIVDGPKAYGEAGFAVIQDPAEAYVALYCDSWSKAAR